MKEIQDNTLKTEGPSSYCCRPLDVIEENLLLVASQLVCILLLSGSLYGILGSDALPGSEIFALGLLAIAAYGGGLLVSLLQLPPLLGMLVVGILFRNLKFIPYQSDISVMWASTFRDISLAIILLKAGLGLDPKKLKEMKFDVVKLSIIPCLSETACNSVFVHFLLGLPWLWSLMLGFILSAVSAAVLVPGMLDVEEQRFGTDKGIPTLILASVSIDNIVALTGFIVTFSTLTSNENLVWTLLKRPLELIAGAVFGAIIGLLFWYLPSERTLKASLVLYRSLMLVVGGLCFSFLSKRIGVSGAGTIGCVCLAYFASLGWRTDVQAFKHVTWITGVIWSLVEPFLFGLIGAEVTFESLQNNIGFPILVIILGTITRAICTLLSLTRSSFNVKEKTFISVSWLAKATVQAAVGSQALDFARSNSMDVNFMEYSNQVLTTSVLSIILTAPLGAAFIQHLAPYLLTKEDSVCDASQDTSVASQDSSASSFEDRELLAEVVVTNYGTANTRKVKDLIRRLETNAND